MTPPVQRPAPEESLWALPRLPGAENPDVFREDVKGISRVTVMAIYQL